MNKKIIICGISNSTNEIIARLSRSTMVVGYTDISSKITSNRYFDSHPYQKIDCFSEDSYDHIVVSYDNARDIDQTFEEFEKYKNKIIVFHWFKDATICDFISKYRYSQINETQIMLGMSHSQVDIQTHILTKPTYKFSMPSMDIFCHYQIVQKLTSLFPDRCRNIDQVIIELPYYIFNYDLSKSVRSVKKRLYYFKMFDNYHNFGNNDEENNVISQFEHYLELFEYGNPSEIGNNTDIQMANSKGHIKKSIFSILNQIQVIKENAKVWKQIRPATIAENKGIFEELISMLHNQFRDAKIIVLVCPFNPIFRLKNRKYINNTKKLFYDILSQSNVEIIDNFTMFKNPFCFLDHCHLTTIAAHEYTKALDNTLNRNR